MFSFVVVAGGGGGGGGGVFDLIVGTKARFEWYWALRTSQRQHTDQQTGIEPSSLQVSRIGLAVTNLCR